MSSLFFSQFKSFCYETEQDAKKVRSQLTHPSPADLVPDLSYLEDLTELVSSQREIFNENRENVQNNQFIVGEIAPDIFTLYKTNQQMISTLTLHLSKYGCYNKHITPSADPQSLNQIVGKGEISGITRELTTMEVNQNEAKLHSQEPPHTKTPTLDLKNISMATKKVLGQQQQIFEKEKEEESEGDEDETKKKDKKSDNNNHNSNNHKTNSNNKEILFTPQRIKPQFEVSTPETPTLPNITLNYFQLLRSKSAEQQQAPPHSTVTMSDSPEPIPETAVRNIGSCSSTPEPHTPDLSGDLNTTTLMKTHGSSGFESRDVMGTQLNLELLTPVKSSPVDGTTGPADLHQENDSGDDLDDILNLSMDAFSPPKTSKILQPRKNQLASSNHEGWIPLISETEWLTAPVFLQRQASVEAMNGALNALNRYIEKTPMKTDPRYIESLTTEELEHLIGKSTTTGTATGTTGTGTGTGTDTPPAKVLTMGLVHLKRLDLSTENSIKLYKIRRYY